MLFIAGLMFLLISGKSIKECSFKKTINVLLIGVMSPRKCSLEENKAISLSNFNKSIDYFSKISWFRKTKHIMQVTYTKFF